MSRHVTEPLLKWDHRSTDDAKINVAQNANCSNDNQPSFNKERVENVWKNPKYNNNNRKKVIHKHGTTAQNTPKIASISVDAYCLMCIIFTCFKITKCARIEK